MASSEPAGFGARFRLTLITDDPDLAETADAAGVDRVGLDLETIGKAERQGTIADARVSRHRLADLARIRRRLKRARLFCRLDPPHPGQGEQIERALDLGAEVLMLPYFSLARDAKAFVERVDGRAETVLLVETAAAAWAIEDVAGSGADEVMVGLNDLAWDAGVQVRFGLLASPLMGALAQAVRAAGRRFSAGGLGRWDDASLPTSADLIHAQYPRLGAEGAWLARAFQAGLEPSDWPAAVAGLRARLDHWAGQDQGTLEQARRDLARSAASGQPTKARSST